MKRAILLMVALTALGAELPDLRVEALRNELGRANEQARRLRATVAAIDEAASARQELAVLEGQLNAYELRLPEVTLHRGRIKRLDDAVTATEERWRDAITRLRSGPNLGPLGPLGFYSSRNQSDLLSAWIDYGRAVDARAAAADEVARLARVERDLEVMRADIAAGSPSAGIPAGMTVDQARQRRVELTRALADAGRVAPDRIDLVRDQLAEAEARVRNLESELAQPVAGMPEPIQPPPTTEPAPQPSVPVIPAGIAQLSAGVIEATGYGAPEGFEDDEVCTWKFTVRFRVLNGIPLQLRLDSLHREPAEIQKPAAGWSQSPFHVPPETPYHPSPRSLFEATGWQPGDAFMFDLGPHTLTVDRRRGYAGTYRARFSGIDANGNPVQADVLWTSPGRPPVGPPKVRPVPQPAPMPQPAPVRASRATPGVYSGGLDPDTLNTVRGKVLGFELLDLSGTDATIRVRNDGRVELEGVFLLTIETSGLLARGTTRESRYFDRRDTSFSGTSPGTSDRLDLEFHSERNFRVRRTNRGPGEVAQPSAMGREAPPGDPDKHETRQGKREARIRFDPKTGDLLLHVSDGLSAVPHVPWRLRRQQ
jgi:hypothetical protein